MKLGFHHPARPRKFGMYMFLELTLYCRRGACEQDSGRNCAPSRPPLHFDFGQCLYGRVSILLFFAGRYDHQIRFSDRERREATGGALKIDQDECCLFLGRCDLILNGALTVTGDYLNAGRKRR